jgi:hypothetical protein
MYSNGTIKISENKYNSTVPSPFIRGGGTGVDEIYDKLCTHQIVKWEQGWKAVDLRGKHTGSSY